MQCSPRTPQCQYCPVSNRYTRTSWKLYVGWDGCHGNPSLTSNLSQGLTLARQWMRQASYVAGLADSGPRAAVRRRLDIGPAPARLLMTGRWGELLTNWHAEGDNDPWTRLGLSFLLRPCGAVFSYKLRYIAGFWLVEMAISTNQKPAIYRNLYTSSWIIETKLQKNTICLDIN